MPISARLTKHTMRGLYEVCVNRTQKILKAGSNCLKNTTTRSLTIKSSGSHKCDTKCSQAPHLSSRRDLDEDYDVGIVTENSNITNQERIQLDSSQDYDAPGVSSKSCTPRASFRQNSGGQFCTRLQLCIFETDFGHPLSMVVSIPQNLGNLRGFLHLGQTTNLKLWLS